MTPPPVISRNLAEPARPVTRQVPRMTKPSRPPGLRVEQLEDRLTPAGTTIPAGEFNWTQYSPTGELAQLVWEGQTLVYRTRAANAWHGEAIATDGTFTAAQYDTRDQVQKASQSAQLVFTADGTPHVLFLDSVWMGFSNAYQTTVRHYARTGAQWTLVESVSPPWLSTWGPSNLVAEAGPGNSLHLLFAETYGAAAGVGNQGSGILWYGTNKAGAWQFDKVADTADLKMDVWFTGGRWAPRFLSMAVDAQNAAHVTFTPQFYIAGAFSTVNSTLMYATNKGGSWRAETVMAPHDGTADAGLGASVAVAPSGQIAVASYYVDRFNTGSPQTSKLMYHTRTANGTWTHTDVVTTPDGYVAGDGAKFTGFAPQLYFDSAGRANIAFSDEAGEHLPVTYANEFAGQIRLATLSAGRWAVQTVYRQSNPLVNQLFYPVAAERNGQTTFAGLVVNSSLDGNKNLTGSNFGVIDVNAPAGPATPITAAPPVADGQERPASVTPGAGGGGGAGSTLPGTPAAAAAANDAQPGMASTIAVFKGNGQLDFTITPFGPDYTGGTRVVRADVTGDGTPDVIVGSGGGIQARVRIWDGQTRTIIFDTVPFEDFTGGVEIAAGDVNGDGLADVVIGPDVGGGPRIQVWAGGTFQKLMADFYGLPYPDFRGGLRLAVGDVNRDGYGDLIVAPGAGGGPRLTVYNGKSFGSKAGATTLVNDFYVFDDTVRTGLYLTAGDVDGDGYADIVAGSGVGGGPRVRVISGADLAAGRGIRSVADFYAADPNERVGARVGVTKIDSDGKADVLTGTAGAGVTVYTGAQVTETEVPAAILKFPAFAGVPGGVYVG
jgi:hypothetical protein